MHTLWESRGPWARLVVALAAVAAGVLLRLSLLDVIGPRTPFVTFYPAATVAALLGGLISGGAATVLLGLVAYFWVLPQLSPYILSNAGWLALSVFVVTGVLISVITEVMHRARRRAALAEAEAALSAQRCELDAAIQRLAAIVESSDDAIIGASMDGTITSWNLGAQRIYGYTPEEAIGKSAAGLMAPPDRPGEIAQVLERIASGQHVRNFETQRRRKDGSLVDVSVTLSPIRSSDCSLAGVSAVVRDITERRRAEEALRQGEERFREVVEGTDNLVTRVDAQGRLIYANPVARSVFGLAPEDCVGRLAFDFVHPEDREATVRAFLGWISAGLRHATLENRQVSLDGTVRTLSWTVDLHYAPDGTLSAVDGIAQDVTERRRAEEALRKSERRLRFSQEIARLGQWELDLATGVLSWCQGVYAMFELDPAHFQPSYELFLSMVHPEDRQAVDAAYRESLEARRPYSIVHRLLMPDGRVKWLKELCRHELDEAGEPIRSMGVVQDITELKLAEQALRESEVFSRTIVESSPDCIKLLNAAGELTYISQGGLRLLEMECSEGVLGRPYTEFWKGSDLAAVETALAEARAGRLGRFEGFCPTASGTPKWWDVSIAPMPGPGGAIERFLVVSRDDTARRQAVEALRESEERFRQLVEHAPDGIFVQTQGRFAYVNRACLALYGAAEPGQLLGQAVPTRVHPDFADQARERIRVLNEERRGVPALEMRHLRLDGSTVDVEVSAEPLVYGGQPGALVFLRDISERKRLESLREDMERIARHDLKTPLNAVINLPLLMLDEGGLSEEQASMLRMVHEAGLRMLDQIDQSLTLYRIETRSFELDPQPVDLPDLLIRVARDLSTLAQGLGVDLALDLGPGPVCARGDVLLCRTMFANLIKNAVEAAGRGGRASVRLEAGPGWASVAVHNPGAVPKSLRGGFFEKYASVGKRRGAGLGTYSARLSAEAQGGSIAMETGEEQGTTITVRLPLWPGEGDAA